MRKPVLVMSILAAGFVIVGFFMVRGLGSATASTELRFFTHDTQQFPLDLGDQGDSGGDRFLFSGDVFDHEGGTKLGRLGGVCDAVSEGGDGLKENVCSTVLALDDGQLITSAMVDHSGLFGGAPQQFSITGGTGIYRDAQGDGTITVLNATDANWVIRLN